MPFSKVVRLDGSNPVDIYYKVYGSDDEAAEKITVGKPTLIWLHGGPGFDHSAHEPFISTLAGAGIQVLLLDQRGHGRSGDRDKPSVWNLIQWAADVAAIISNLELEHVVVGGLSFGGAVAQRFAIDHGAVAKGVLLCDTEPRLDKEAMLMRFKIKAKAAALAEDKEEAEADALATHVYEIADRVFSDPTDEEALREHFAKGIPLCGRNPHDTDRPMDCDMNMAVAKYYFANELFKYDHRAELADVECPVLLVHGDQNAVHCKEGAEELAASLPAECVKVVYKAGAATPVYDFDPDVVRSEMLAFIKAPESVLAADAGPASSVPGRRGSA